MRGLSFCSVSWIALVAVCGLLGCVEEGYSPDCPNREDYLDQEGTFDFPSWRDDAETAGCVTPIGGYGGSR